MPKSIRPRPTTQKDAKALQKELQQTITAIVNAPPYVAPPPSKAAFFIHLYKIIPLAGGLFTDIANSMKDIIQGEGLGQLIHLTDRIPSELVDVAKGLPFVGMASHVFNLARMGIVWLGAKQSGTPLPFGFSKKAKMAYSLTALTLSILIIVFALSNPFVAGALAVAAASLGLFVAVTTLARTYWRRSQERIELRKLPTIIDDLESSLSKIKKDLKMREKILAQAMDDQRYDILHEQAQGIGAQKERYDILHKALEIASQRKRLLEEKPKTKRGRFFDRHLAIPLALVALIGAILALSNPFVGLAIAGVGTAVGLSIVVTFYVAIPFTNWIFQKCKNHYYKSINKEKKSLDIATKIINDNEIQPLPEAASVAGSLQNSSPLTPLFEHAHPGAEMVVTAEELERRKVLIEKEQVKQQKEASAIEDIFSKLDKITMPAAMLFEDKNKAKAADKNKDEGETEGERDAENEGERDSEKDGNKPKVKH